MFEITQPSLNGITAHVMTASTKAIIGARKNTNLSAPAGTTISLTMYFRKSANDCSNPKGPTMFGPLRICTAAQIFRSAYIRNASATKSGISTKRHCPRITSTMPRLVLVKNSTIVFVSLHRWNASRAAIGDGHFGVNCLEPARKRGRDRINCVGGPKPAIFRRLGPHVTQESVSTVQRILCSRALGVFCHLFDRISAGHGHPKVDQITVEQTGFDPIIRW